MFTLKLLNTSIGLLAICGVDSIHFDSLSFLQLKRKYLEFHEILKWNCNIYAYLWNDVPIMRNEVTKSVIMKINLSIIVALNKEIFESVFAGNIYWGKMSMSVFGLGQTILSIQFK